jgi:azurin
MRPTVTLSLAFAAMTLVAFVAAPALAVPKTAAPRTIEIRASDNMKFDVTTIQAKRGEKLTVRLIAVGTLPKIAMSHNFILLKKGVTARAFADNAISAQATGYLPAAAKSQVIASTGVIGNGERTEVTFTVPTVPGRYEYICTFPGHCASGMKGVLIVS